MLNMCPLLKSLVIAILVVLGISFVHSENAPTWSNKCGQTLRIKNSSTDYAEFDQRSEFDEETLCKWELIGDKECLFEASCTVRLPSNPDGSCGDAYLLITDGYSSVGKYCGKQTIPFLRPGKYLRDLYLELHTGPSPDKILDYFACTARCVDAYEIHALYPERLLPDKWKFNTESSCVCGLKNDDQRIVGGEDTKFKEFPWMAAIVYYDTREPFCGGSLINDRFILTSASCFVKPNPNETFQADDIDVLLRAHVLDKTEQNQNGTNIKSSGDNLENKTDADEKSLRFAVKEILIHPLFTQNNDYDYALLRLKKHVKLSDEDAPTPICLATPTTPNSFEMEGKTMVVSGWGLSDENAKESTKILQKLEVPHISKEKCEGYYPNHITDRMICFGYENGTKDSCVGDSGGPLIYQLPSKQWWQFGMVSHGKGCARANSPGVYSKVTEVAQWIHFHADHHGAKWCQDQQESNDYNL